MDEYYVNSFSSFSSEIEPVLASLHALHGWINQISDVLGVSFALNDDSGSETASSTSDISSGSEASTARPAQASNEALDSDTSDAELPAPFHLHDNNPGRLSPLFPQSDGSADAFMQELRAAAAAHRPSDISPQLDLAPKTTNPFPPPRRHRSALQAIDPLAPPVVRVYTVALHLVCKCIAQGKVLQEIAVKNGALARTMAGFWKKCDERVGRGEGRLGRRRGGKKKGEEEEGGLDGDGAGKRMGPRVDSGRCGYL
ncbi:MAG: hypothetical protein Q9195_003816 [Heterodermia aff. obscurata]